MGILMGILMMDSMGWPYDSSDCLLFFELQFQCTPQRGRPKGSSGRRTAAELLANSGQPAPSETDQRRPSSCNNKLPTVSPGLPLKREQRGLARSKEPGWTANRPSFYLLGQPSSSFGFSKLPRTEVVLGRFLLHHQDKTLKDSAACVTEELKSV